MPEEVAINLAARRAYGELLRQFHAGRMTNFEYEDRFDRLTETLGTDRTIDAIYLANWTTYCDIRKHRMTGAHRMTGRGRRLVAQAVLLLKTGFDVAPELIEAQRRGARACVVGLCVAGLLLIAGFVFLPQWVVAGALALLLIAGWTWNGISRLVQWARGTREQEEPALSEHWPFESESDLSRTRSCRVYLCGSAA